MEYTIEGIDEFDIVPVSAGHPREEMVVVVTKVHLEPFFGSSMMSAKNVVELESDLDGRRN